MSLLFGNLTQSFVNFGIAVNNAKTDPTAAAMLPAAADHFRTVAASDAADLVYIGTFLVLFLGRRVARYACACVLTMHELIGVGMFVCTFTYMCIWVYTGEVNAKRIREKYLQAVLRQDVSFFDNVGAGEVATRIQTDTRTFPTRLNLTHICLYAPLYADLVQQGISEKVALVVNFLAAFVTGFVLAYSRSWRLALAMTSMLPCIVVTGGVMNRFISKYMQ